jgi:hypothetical protein
MSEDSNGYWVKQEYDSNNNEIYYEDSDGTKFILKIRRVELKTTVQSQLLNSQWKS